MQASRAKTQSLRSYSLRALSVCKSTSGSAVAEAEVGGEFLGEAELRRRHGLNALLLNTRGVGKSFAGRANDPRTNEGQHPEVEKERRRGGFCR